MKKHKIYLLFPYIFILLSVIILFGRTLIPEEGKIIYGSDLKDQFYFWKLFYSNSIREGIIPFWNPYNFSGTPFLAHPSIAPFYPLNILFIVLPLRLAFSAFLFIHIFFSGIFMYWFSRRNLDRISSLISASIFALSGYFAARIYSGHIDIISTFAWTPLVFGLITTATQTLKKRDVILGVFALTMQILAGYQFVVILTLESILLFWVFMVIGNIRKIRVGNEIKVVIVLSFIVLSSYGLAAVQFLPTYEFVKNSIRSAGLPYNLATWGSYNIDTFKLFIFPFSFGNPFPENYSYFGPGPNFFELFYFVGRIPILLIVLYIVTQVFKVVVRREVKFNKNMLFYLMSVTFFFIVAMGGNLPLHKVFFDLLPPYRMFRFPSQHLKIVVFLLAAASGYVSSRIKIKAVKTVILFLVVLELLTFNRRFFRLDQIPVNSFNQRLIESISNSKELGRLLPVFPVISWVRKDLDFGASSYYNIQTTSGYNPIILNNYYGFIDLLNKSESSSIQFYNVEIPPTNINSGFIDFLNVKYVLDDKGFNIVGSQVGDKYKLILEDERFNLYENKTYLPRFFFVNKAEMASTEKDLKNLLIKDDSDLSQKIYINKEKMNKLTNVNDSCNKSDTNYINVKLYSSNNIIVEVATDCDSYLSSSEVYYPGWKAKVDGRTTSIILSNYAFRTINIPKGKHTIEYYYKPSIYYLGGLISLFTGFVLFIYYKRVS